VTIFSKFGPAGTLNGITDFTRIHVNGGTPLTSEVTAEMLGDRCVLETVGGYPAFRMKHHTGDALAASGRRTELVRESYSGIYDWVGEGVPGASTDDAIKEYRPEFMVPKQDLSWLSSSFAIVWQLHQTPDDDDTAGLNPALSQQIKMDAYGRLRWALVQNFDTDETVTVNDPTKHTVEVASWPFKFDTWECPHIKAHPWAYSSNGNLTVYRNRHPVLVRMGTANCPNNTPARGGDGIYFKFGIYMGVDRDFEIFHRGEVAVDHEGTFAEMYPEITGAIPLERVVGPKMSGG
jgi:hypothetical protein